MLFLAGNTNKALCSAAILAVLDALYAIPSGIWKARWRKQPKFERRIRKRNHAFGNESTSRYDRLLSLVVVLYTSVGYSECQRSACVTSAEQSAVYLLSAKKNIVTVFRSVKAARLGGFWTFQKWGQINDYGESSIMTCGHKMVGYILWKLGASKANCA